MSEARLVTREQLAAALMTGVPLNVGTPYWAQQKADAIFAALHAAAPAEGLREAVRSALAQPPRAAKTVLGGYLATTLDDESWEPLLQAELDDTFASGWHAALARHESGSE